MATLLDKPTFGKPPSNFDINFSDKPYVLISIRNDGTYYLVYLWCSEARAIDKFERVRIALLQKPKDYVKGFISLSLHDYEMNIIKELDIQRELITVNLLEKGIGEIKLNG